jgi:BlaI family penicillinase repressor
MRPRPAGNQPLPPNISEAEWKVMQVLWRLGSASLREIVEGVGEGSRWKPRTVQTLVRRLVGKGAVAAKEKGREFVYSPIFSQAECQHDESRSFLGRVFEGRLVPFLAGMVEKEAVSPEEIDELRRLLDDAERRLGDSTEPCGTEN